MSDLQKITEQQMDAVGVCSAPDVLSGSISENKAVFDKMVRQLVAPAYNAAVDAIEAINQTESGIQANEAKRAAAEAERAEAEAGRADAENARVRAEQDRTEAERARSDGEAARQEAENERKAAEQARTEGERDRMDAEAARQQAEQQRVDSTTGIVAQATGQAKAARDSAVLSQSWAVGETGTREGENTDNARYWAKEAQNAAGGGVTSFNGRIGAVLPQAGDYTAKDVGAIPTSQKGTAGGVATLESDSQIPYSQTPHLTGSVTLYVDATSGSDTNSGTQQSPFATIGAALNSLPRDFGGRDVKIQLAQGRYDEQVNINGFHNGNLEINGDSKNANLYYVRTISAIAIPRLKVVGISTSYINGYIVQSLDVGNCNFEKVTDNTGLLSSFGSNATLYKVDFKNYGDAAISVWSGGRLSAGSCTGSGNAVGIKVNSGDGFPGFAILNNCNFGATTEIQKNYSSIVFKDGVQV